MVTIHGPLGPTPTGSSTITGACTTTAGTVTVTGTGFTPSSITTSCIAGLYTTPVTITGPTAITVSQTNSAGTAIATASTTLPSGSSNSGGCLPGYPCSNTTSSPNTQVTPVTVPTTTVPVATPTNPSSPSCPVFAEYLKKGMRDGRNGISEVSKVQSFLNRTLGLSLITDGIFGKHTHRAVAQFQSQYFNQVLTPWGLTSPTGWWYQSTRSYANFLENCSEGVVQLDNTVKVLNGNVVQ